MAWLFARLRNLLPFRSLARSQDGILAPHSRTRPPAPLSQAEPDMIFAIRWAIGAFASWLPFRTLCFQQAIAACTMLEPRASAMSCIWACAIHLSETALGTTHGWTSASLP